MTTENTDWRKPALAEYLERRAIKSKEIAEAKASAERFLTIAKAREIELTELDKAAAVLGISKPAQAAASIATADATPSAQATVTRGTADARGGFKEQAIEVLKASYPTPMRAAEVQQAVERKLLRQFHEKTAGMTLFRLSKDGVVRRSGWEWYFVPENDRPLNLRDADENAPMPDNAFLEGLMDQ